MVASISLLLLILILLTTCSWCFFSSTPLTLLYLLLSSPFPFIFSKLKQKVKPSQESPQQEKKRTDIKVAAFEEVISDELIDSDQKLMLDSDCSVLEDSNLFGSSQSSENSISDDESLIEIALPDGRYIDFGKISSEFEHELLDYLPKSLFLQHGLMELLLEINEEDNMIEIDIAMGSIKCPRFQIKD
ncbi:hypothetical protein KFK09_004592 [Dendrobium nobile]|uniref:Uncharacterized protein n=1 Tax=Dendrobium nobile TaxID=94219 RepID=A0A8T3C4H4_DENNO|nr:hypothetical protein KFK09_004592 [Dendrobium nobile]